MKNFWKLYILGTRGSLPICGESFREFGGATSCYILKKDRHAIIIDCGTGLFYSRNILADCTEIDVLLTHVHYDHILGILAWEVFPKTAKLQFYSRFDKWFGKDTLARFMGAPFWPYTPDFSDCLCHVDSPGSVMLSGGLKVWFYPSMHPNEGSVIRIDTEDGSVCAMFDYEHAGPVPDEFVKDSLILLYYSTFTKEEYEQHIGWGHSCWEEGCALAQRANVGYLYITHHDPQRNDADLRKLEKQAQKVFCNTRFARCGDIFRFDGELTSMVL